MQRRLRVTGRGVRLALRLLVALDVRGVVLNKLLEVAVSPASVEVVFLHLGIDLFKVPVVMIEAINRAYDACAMASAGAVT